jgi:hypothetical protein
MIDRLYEQPVTRQFTREMASGLLGFGPALVWAPVTFARYVALPLTEMARMKSQSYRIRHGYVFNYGALRSIREDPINYRRAHNFVKEDQLTFIMLACVNTMIRA